MTTKNIFLEELKKFLYNTVIVYKGDKDYTGQVRGINFLDRSIILMTDTEKIIINNPDIIKRKRNYDKKGGNNET